MMGYYVFAFRPDSVQQNQSKEVGFIKTGSSVIANQIYYSTENFKLGNFDAILLGGWYSYENGKHISKHNILSYKNRILPISITTTTTSDYLGNTPNEQVTNYIQNFILLDAEVLQTRPFKNTTHNPQEGNIISSFSLDCLNSPLKIRTEFCEYNLDQFAQNVRKYDISQQFSSLREIFKNANKVQTRNAICQSVINFEFLHNNIDGRFSDILSNCEPKYLTIHQELTKRNALLKELSTVLKPSLDKDLKRNELKLVSSMQIIQSQLRKAKVDLPFLNSYFGFVSQFLRQPELDQFFIDLIYKYHNQYLLKGLVDTQKIVDLDGIQDIQHIIDKFDSLNNGDAHDLIGLKHRVSQSIVSPTDYTQEHPGFGENSTPITPQISSSSSSKSGDVDVSIINALISEVESSINEGLSNSGTTNSSQADLAINSPNKNTTTANPLQSNTGKVNKTEDLDLNTYQPKSATVYQPVTTESKQKSIISDRMYNNLGIKPHTIIDRGTNYLVGRTYNNYEFSALLDQNNDRKLGPIYVKLDGHLVVIPDLEIYLMDYDRYTQVKFLKNPDAYVRQATQ